MVRITEELLRKRAEHNHRELDSLEELSLHQENIERIEVVNSRCRQLRILYLQSNLIGRIEGLHRLKQLEYLNLALNNIRRIEGLDRCESLRKLDLTINFIAELTSVTALADNPGLRELYLTGNPCTSFEGYREYVIHALPQLEMLDGHRIERTERIRAAQSAAAVAERIREQQAAALREQAETRASEQVCVRISLSRRLVCAHASVVRTRAREVRRPTPTFGTAPPITPPKAGWRFTAGRKRSASGKSRPIRNDAQTAPGSPIPRTVRTTTPPTRRCGPRMAVFCRPTKDAMISH
jgi:hypothetical protein